MKYLKSISESKAGAFQADANFETLENRVFYMTPTVDPATGLPTVNAGPPTSGTWNLDELWIDANRVLWRNTVPGTPGTWTPVFVGTVLTFEQSSPATTWGPFTHNFGVRPTPTVIIGGRSAGANVEVTTTTATVTLESAQTGFLILRA